MSLIIPPRYSKLNKAFSGGMSSAGLYRDTHLDRDVIVKRLEAGVDQKRLLDEIQALTTIRSKHVVELYDVLRDSKGEIAAIVEEFCPGAELASFAGHVNLEQFMAKALAVSMGLADIHDHGHTHRDIKLTNIKLDAEGNLKIFDFGLSRSNADAKTTGLKGTFGYLAPELCVEDDEEAEFDQSVDVFAFASLALKLITGKLPKGLTKIPLQLPCDEADFTKLALNLPTGVANLLNQCHSDQPSDRPDIHEVRDALAAECLRDKHRASLVVGSKAYSLHAGNRIVNVTAGTLGSFSLIYDGLVFKITSFTGDVYINNVAFTPPKVLPGSCVVTVGAPSAGMNRVYVPVDVSYPEIMA